MSPGTDSSAASCCIVQGTEGHNTASIGGFVMLPPVILAAVAAAAGSSGSSTDEVAAAASKQALEHLRTTHDSKKLAVVADRYAQLLTRAMLVRRDDTTAPAPAVMTQQHHQ
jgi:hypothetical protein